MRDLTLKEVNCIITCLDSAKEDEGASVMLINELLELFEMEQLLLKGRRGPVRKEPK